MSVQTPADKNSPLMVAWEAYKQSEEFANSLRWALRIAPMVQAGDQDGDAKRERELMPREQREVHVQGSLWAAFAAGFLHTHHNQAPFVVSETERRDGHKALRVRDGKMETFDPHPETPPQPASEAVENALDAVRRAFGNDWTPEQGEAMDKLTDAVRASLRASGKMPEVWGVENHTTFALFATEEAARAYVSGFTVSVSGGMHVTALPVFTTAAPKHSEGGWK